MTGEPKLTELLVEVKGKLVTQTGDFTMETYVSNPFSKTATLLCTLQYNMQNIALKEALVKMGWTPPPQEKDVI